MLSDPNQKTQLVLDFIRHGEPEGGVRYRGSVDDPLSDTGWKQMRQSTQSAIENGCCWDKTISSPMLRCVRFAEELSLQQQIPLQTLPDLRELCFGDLEGLTPKQAWDEYPALLSNLWQVPEEHTPPNGETFNDFVARVGASLNYIIEQHDNQHLLVVAHGGVIRATLTHLLSIPPRDTFKIEVPYAGMSRITVFKQPEDDYRASLNFLNRFHGEG